MPRMTFVDKALAQIDGYLETTGMAESRLGLLSAASGGAIKRIRNGTAQITTLQAVLRYIEQNPARRS